MNHGEFFKLMAGRKDIDLGIVHHFGAGTYIKQMSLPKGNVMGTHSHRFDHLSVLGAGVAIVTTDGGATMYHAPAVIEIKAGVHHTIAALEDVTWFCVHATDERNPAKIDETLVGAAA